MDRFSFKDRGGQQPIESPQVRHRNLNAANRLALLLDLDIEG